jgi:hypothetical protein
MQRLLATWWASHISQMFMVTEEDAAAIRAAFDQDGELSAVVELRRRFPASPTCPCADVRPEHRRLDAIASGPMHGDAVRPGKRR